MKTYTDVEPIDQRDRYEDVGEYQVRLHSEGGPRPRRCYVHLWDPDANCSRCRVYVIAGLCAHGHGERENCSFCEAFADGVR